MLEEEELVVMAPMVVSSGGILKEIRRVSDPDKAQIIWDGIKTVRAQKQIPALPRLSRWDVYCNSRNRQASQQSICHILGGSVQLVARKSQFYCCGYKGTVQFV